MQRNLSRLQERGPIISSAERAGAVNQRWSLDFLSDAFFDERRFPALHELGGKLKPISAVKKTNRQTLQRKARA